jgi:hypothetical protein
MCAWFGCVCEFDFCHNCAEMDPIFDLVICHHGSLPGHRMEYIGGDRMEVNRLDADKFCFLGPYKYPRVVHGVQIQ